MKIMEPSAFVVARHEEEIKSKEYLGGLFSRATKHFLTSIGTLLGPNCCEITETVFKSGDGKEGVIGIKAKVFHNGFEKQIEVDCNCKEEVIYLPESKDILSIIEKAVPDTTVVDSITTKTQEKVKAIGDNIEAKKKAYNEKIEKTVQEDLKVGDKVKLEGESESLTVAKIELNPDKEKNYFLLTKDGIPLGPYHSDFLTKISSKKEGVAQAPAETIRLDKLSLPESVTVGMIIPLEDVEYKVINEEPRVWILEKVIPPSPTPVQ
jgi:hypothetical protein